MNGLAVANATNSSVPLLTRYAGWIAAVAVAVAVVEVLVLGEFWCWQGGVGVVVGAGAIITQLRMSSNPWVAL